MPSLGYDPSRIEETLEPTLPNPSRAPLCLSSFGSFFGFFSNISILNTPSTYSAVSSPTLTPTTLNRRIRQVITCLNR